MSCLTFDDQPFIHELVSHTVIQDNVTWGVFFNDNLLFRIQRSKYLEKKGLVQPGLYVAGDWASTLKTNETVGPYMGTEAKPDDLDNGYVFQNSPTHTPIDGKSSITGLQFMNSVKKDRGVAHNVTFGNVRGRWPPVKVAGTNRLKDSVELLANYDWRTGSKANEASGGLSVDGKRRLEGIQIYNEPIEKTTKFNKVGLNDPKNWKICLLSKDPVVLTNVFDPDDMASWVKNHTIVKTKTKTRSKRSNVKNFGSAQKGWVDFLVSAAMTVTDDVVVPPALSGIVGGIQFRKASKYDMILTDAGQQAVMDMAPPNVRKVIEAEVAKYKTADCPNASFHVMVTLPQKTRVNQTKHTDVPEAETCYRTIIVPLTEEDPKTIDPRDKLPLGGGTMFDDVGLVNPYLGLASFGGNVPHYGLGNVSLVPRVFLFVVIHGNSDVNEPINYPGHRTQSSKTGRLFVDDTSLWTDPAHVKQLNLTLLDPPHDGDCGTHLLRMIFGVDNEMIRKAYDEIAQSITGKSYKLMRGRYVDMNFLVAFIVSQGHNVMVFANKDQRSFNGYYYVGRPDFKATVLIIRTVENDLEHWVGIADPESATLSKETVKKLQGLLKQGELPLTAPEQILRDDVIEAAIEEAKERGDLEQQTKKTRWINMATPSPPTSEDESVEAGTAENPIVLDVCFADLAIY